MSRWTLLGDGQRNVFFKKKREGGRGGRMLMKVLFQPLPSLLPRPLPLPLPPHGSKPSFVASSTPPPSSYSFPPPPPLSIHPFPPSLSQIQWNPDVGTVAALPDGTFKLTSVTKSALSM